MGQCFPIAAWNASLGRGRRPFVAVETSGRRPRRHCCCCGWQLTRRMLVVVIMMMPCVVEEHMLIGSRLQQQQPCSKEQRMPWPRAGGQGEAPMLAGTCLLPRIMGVEWSKQVKSTAALSTYDDATTPSSWLRQQVISYVLYVRTIKAK